MQVSTSMTALPRTRLMADTGQIRTQSPHPTQRVGLTCDLSVAAAMHSAIEITMPEVRTRFFMIVYLIKLLFA
jgi:hypothetical protein